MNRFHVHMRVRDLDESIRFYSILFGTPPTATKADYAKWMLDDPRVNFAISTHGGSPGIDHLGIQVETGEELSSIAQRLGRAGRQVLEQKQAACCYARSDKAWVVDPHGVRWETFQTHGELTTYGECRETGADPAPAPEPQAAACCAPTCRTPAA
jgi:catechol 2,3-dioxygenase-like lactoylglutathione lyase family enzyme